MTDGQWLFTIFAVLYLLECGRWLPGAIFVLAGNGKIWSLRRPWAQLQIAGTNLVALPVLPPMQVHLITLPWLLLPCEEGVEVCLPEAPSTTVLLWSDLILQVEESHLILTHQFHLRLPDEAAARVWKERVLLWSGMKQPAREKDFLKFARQSLDAKSLASHASELSSSTRWLRGLAVLIFLWVFGVITAIYRWLGEGAMVMSALAVLVLLLWTQAVVFFRMATRSQTRVPHRFWKALAIAFLPQQAMRATDTVCRAQTSSWHPLAARELLEDAAWRKAAVQFWRNLKYGQARSAALQATALEAFFKEQGIAADELEDVPARSAGSEAYCPHCHAQFVKANILCRDCGEVPLKTWPTK